NGSPVTNGLLIPVTGTPSIANGNLVYTTPTGASSTNNFTFQLKDDGGTANTGADTSATATLTINVSAGANHEPVGIDHTVTGAVEDTAYTFGLSDFPFNDSDNNTQTLDSVKITTLPARGSLTNNGSAVIPGQFISRADILANRLRYLAAPNANLVPAYASFTFQV